jgi:ABC-type uncharacterized transport system auxiliary subunit
MMKRRLGNFLLLGFSAIIFQGFLCLGKIHHYDLYDSRAINRVPENSKIKDLDTLHCILGVRRFTSSEMYERPTIAYREWKSMRDSISTKVKFHSERRWSSMPTQVITDMTIQMFQASMKFKNVIPYPSPYSQPDFILEGEIRNLEAIVVQGGGDFKGTYIRLNFTFRLINKQNNSIDQFNLYTDSFMSDEKLPANFKVNTTNQAVRLMSQGVQNTILELIPKVHQAVEDTIL